MKILHVVGTRPNFMKIPPIIREMRKYPDELEQILVHTGQHYDDNMSKVFFEDMELPQPDIYLGVGSGSQGQQTARIMLAFEPVLMDYRPDWVVVVGDVNSTVACALTAVKLGIKVAHVEAGLRSFDRTMPEEINRVLTDHITDLLFTTEPSANENLHREGIPAEKVYFVGNVMIDTLVRLLPKAEERWNVLWSTLNSERRMRGMERYILVTLHRPSNVDEIETLQEIVRALNDIAQEVPVIFPVHPRTRKRMEEWEIENGNVFILDPLRYIDFLSLMHRASLVITDSGGIQEETTFLTIPCLTVRPNTERPVTITHGTNRLIASKHRALVEAAHEVFRGGCPPSLNVHRPALWDGHTAERIVAILRTNWEDQA